MLALFYSMHAIRIYFADKTAGFLGGVGAAFWSPPCGFLFGTPFLFFKREMCEDFLKLINGEGNYE